MDNLEKIMALEGKESFSILKNKYLNYIKENPFSSKAYNLLALLILKYEKNLESALEFLSKSISLNEKNLEALNNRAIIYLYKNNLDEALNDLDHCIKLDKNNSNSYNNRGVIKRRQKRINEAIEDFSKALQIDPNFHDCLYNRGTAYLKILDFKKSFKDLNYLIYINKNYPNAYLALGNVYRKLNDLSSAMTNYNKAIEFPLTKNTAQLNKATLLLLKGNFNEGLNLYETRFKTIFKNSHNPGDFEKLWSGKENLHKKKILIRSEQGLGDTIQFSRYIDKFKDLNCDVIFEVQKNLVSLLKGISGAKEVVENLSYKGKYDYFCPLLSLPKVFNTDLTNIPTKKSYINFSNKEKISSKWPKILGLKKKPRIGLCWSCNPKAVDSYYKSMSLKDFASELNQDYEWISLQIEYHDDEKSKLEKFNIKDLSGYQTDFEDTALLILEMDLVISIDTSIVHCSASLGKKTILLLPYVPDWRWFREGSKSPWYTELTLVRKNFNSSWAEVFKESQKLAENIVNLK